MTHPNAPDVAFVACASGPEDSFPTKVVMRDIMDSLLELRRFWDALPPALDSEPEL